MIGLPLFSGMHATGPNKWSGQIYNADDGNSYASNISVAGPDALKVDLGVDARLDVRVTAPVPWPRRSLGGSSRTTWKATVARAAQAITTHTTGTSNNTA